MLVSPFPTSYFSLQQAAFENDEAALFRQAKVDQMLSHWMFSMLTGFDVFNDWYDSDLDESEPSVSTYVVIEQSNDRLYITSYRSGDLTNGGADYQQTNGAG